MNMFDDWLSLGIPLEYNPETIPRMHIHVRGANDPYAEILCLSDTHFGSNYQSLNQLARYLKMLRERPNMMAFFAGDLIDLEKHRGERFLGECLDVKELLNTAGQYLKPVATKILAAIPGEHDIQLQNSMVYGTNFLAKFFNRIQPKDHEPKTIVNNDPERRAMLVIVHVGDQTYPIYMFHPSTGAFVNQFLPIKRANHNIVTPLIICGHTHNIDERRQEIETVIKVAGKWYEVGGTTQMLLTGGFIKQTPQDEVKQKPINVVGAQIVRLMKNAPNIEIINPRTHYPEFFGPTGRRYVQDESFRFSDDDWPFRVRRRVIPVKKL